MRPNAGTRKRFEYSAISIAGVRPVNEDAWCAAPVGEGLLVCAVADGIGGYEAGDVASALAIRIFGETVLEAEIATGDHETAAEVLRRGHTLAHEAILKQTTGKCFRMGTTLVSACFRDGKVTLCNTGDSRCTLIRTGTVRPLTKDHCAGPGGQGNSHTGGGRLPPDGKYHHALAGGGLRRRLRGPPPL
ncbi:MAG: protein serine/threonine phosphatase 2C family protein [Deltaproteobacteria bacterium]|nr:protein serine/threonine phosphatase 2C family protein [Deltaproteobacteria bacterium]